MASPATVRHELFGREPDWYQIRIRDKWHLINGNRPTTKGKFLTPCGWKVSVMVPRHDVYWPWEVSGACPKCKKVLDEWVRSR